MNDLLKMSMLYEKAYIEVLNLIHALKKREDEDELIAINTGRQPSEHFLPVRNALTRLKNNYRSLSDDYFNMHKKSAEIDEDGIYNLANGIIERAVLDYEIAVSKRDEIEQKKLEQWKDDVGQSYTTADLDIVFEKVRSSHEKFAEIASENLLDIVDITNRLRRSGTVFSDPQNPYRCPMCGGGMYSNTKTKHNAYLISCGTCMLSEVVAIEI